MKITIFGDSLTAQATADELRRRGVFVATTLDELAGTNACIVAFSHGHSKAGDDVRRLRSILDGCLNLGVPRVVVVTSIAAMGTAARPLDARDFLIPGSTQDPYFLGPSYLEAEIYRYLLAGLSVIPVLTSIAVSERGDAYGVTTLIRRWPVLPVGGVDLVDVRDLVAGVIQAERTGRSGRRYVFCGQFYTTQKLVNLLNTSAQVVDFDRAHRLAARLLRSRAPRLSLATSALVHARRVEDQRAQVELGYRSRSVEPLLTSF